MAFISELWRFIIARKKFFVVPVLLVTLLIGGLLVLTSGSAVAPFIYTLF